MIFIICCAKKATNKKSTKVNCQQRGDQKHAKTSDKFKGINTKNYLSCNGDAWLYPLIASSTILRNLSGILFYMEEAGLNYLNYVK